MNMSATNSSLDVAYWFINRAEQDHMYLETEKLQHLLFLAQSQYAIKQKGEMLMPCLFVCEEKGFYEPTLRKIFLQGRPFMPAIKLNSKISDFLEEIWQKFGSCSVLQVSQIVKKDKIYTYCHRQGINTVALWNYFIDKNKMAEEEMQPIHSISDKNHKKILISQYGPVVVSQWMPRKVNYKDIADE